MRVLDQASRESVQSVIDAHLAELKAIPNFVTDEPGFPIVHGAIVREPAIIVLVSNKKPATHLLQEAYYQRVFLDDWEKRAQARLEDDPAARVATEGEPHSGGYGSYVLAGLLRLSFSD
jgi:hypothetical protein